MDISKVEEIIVNTITCASNLGTVFDYAKCTEAINELGTQVNLKETMSQYSMIGYKQGSTVIGNTTRKVRKNKTKKSTAPKKTFGYQSEFFIEIPNVKKVISIKLFNTGYIGIAGTLPPDNCLVVVKQLINSVMEFIIYICKNTKTKFIELTSVKIQEPQIVTFKCNGKFMYHCHFELFQLKQFINSYTEKYLKDKNSKICSKIEYESGRYSGLQLIINNGEHNIPLTLFSTGKIMLNYRYVEDNQFIIDFMNSVIKGYIVETIETNKLLYARYCRIGKTDSSEIPKLYMYSKKFAVGGNIVIGNSVTETSVMINLNNLQGIVGGTVIDNNSLEYTVDGINVVIFSKGNTVLKNVSSTVDKLIAYYFTLFEIFNKNYELIIKDTVVKHKKKYKTRTIIVN